MNEPVDFEARKKAKKVRCQICGEDAHEFVGQCRRIAAISQDPDGTETYILHPLPEPPAAA